MLQIVPGLLREAQEVDAEARLHEQRHDPPGGHERRREGRPPAERDQRPRPDRAGVALVEGEQERADQHPGRDRRVDPAAGRGDDQRERGRPPGRVAPDAAAHGHEQPGQRGVAEQGDGRAGAEDDHVRVQQHQQARDRVGDAARPPGELVHQLHRAPRGERQDQPEPQPLHEPRAEPECVQRREERPHREQVAAVLAALHVPEIAGRRPRAGDVCQEPGRVDMEVDLRVRRGLPGPLEQREDEREGRQRNGQCSVSGALRQGGEDRGARGRPGRVEATRGSSLVAGTPRTAVGPARVDALPGHRPQPAHPRPTVER